MNDTYNLGQWSPIKPLGDEDRKVDLAELNSLQAAWKTVQDGLKQSGQTQLKEFREKLLRSWSIETGIIERLYDLDEGTTQTLVESGFLVSSIDRSSTNIEPSQLIEILRDQHEAAEFIVNADRDRPLNRHFLLELHSLLTRNQPTTEGQDPYGHMVAIPLLRGQFKTLPNNPTRPDGIIHQYSPPVQVVSEIEQLLEWLETYRNEHPIVVAAWLHHRFSQIHPFQDGNGRVARCLMAFVLLRGGWLPLVVTRHDRIKYIGALERADNGDLRPLIQLFATLEQSVLIRAVSSAGAPELLPSTALNLEPNATSDLLDQVTGGIAAKLRLRQESERAAFRSVNDLAKRLMEEAKILTQVLLRRATQTLSEQSATNFELMDVRDTDEGGPHLGKREHYFRSQIIDTAQSQGHWANFSEAHFWFQRTLRETDSRLTFVISFHHIGHDLTGIMEATCFAHIRYGTKDPSAANKSYTSCTMRPFTFTWRDNSDAVSQRLNPWLTECLALALRQWGETL